MLGEGNLPNTYSKQKQFTMNIQTLTLLTEELDQIIEKLSNELEYTNNPELINEIVTRLINPLENVSMYMAIIYDDINDGVYEVIEEDQESEEWD